MVVEEGATWMPSAGSSAELRELEGDDIFGRSLAYARRDFGERGSDCNECAGSQLDVRV